MPKRRKTIRIPAPIAEPGGRVMALNYHATPEAWRPGEISHVSWGVGYGMTALTGQWHYSVILDDDATLHVGDDRVVRMEDYRA